MEPLLRHLFQPPNFKNMLEGHLTKSIDLTDSDSLSLSLTLLTSSSFDPAYIIWSSGLQSLGLKKMKTMGKLFLPSACSKQQE